MNASQNKGIRKCGDTDNGKINILPLYEIFFFADKLLYRPGTQVGFIDELYVYPALATAAVSTDIILGIRNPCMDLPVISSKRNLEFKRSCSLKFP